MSDAKDQLREKIDGAAKTAEKATDATEKAAKDAATGVGKGVESAGEHIKNLGK